MNQERQASLRVVTIIILSSVVGFAVTVGVIISWLTK